MHDNDASRVCMRAHRLYIYRHGTSTNKLVTRRRDVSGTTTTVVAITPAAAG
jgi:hypothetical protein